MNTPLISIVIPTFNSERTLTKTLNSIKRQTYRKEKVEILIVDGGSTDNTLEIAKTFNCRIIKNIKTELIYGKHLGYLKAKGKYLMFLDSDEVLENKNSLQLKISAFYENKDVKAVILSGYKSPANASLVNDYINEFGDPFSFFMYRESKGEKFLIKDFKSKYKVVVENNDYVIFDFSKERHLPLLELWAGGCMIDLEYCRQAFLKITKNPHLIAHLFYLLNSKNKFIGITKNDPTIHHPVQNIYHYLKKLKSRIKNNIFRTPMGESGFLGREQFEPLFFKIKKYLFLAYSFSIVMPFFDSVYLTISRKKVIYVLHFLFSYGSFLLIFYYSLLKLFQIDVKHKYYGN